MWFIFNACSNLSFQYKKLFSKYWSVMIYVEYVHISLESF